MGQVEKRDGRRFYITNSGLEIEFRPVSPMAMKPFQRRLKEPEPPVEETDVGLVKNEGDPDYKQALAEYNERLEALAQDIYVELGTVGVVFDKREVGEIREAYEKFDGEADVAELPRSDKVIWLSMLAIPDIQDYIGLYLAILEESNPTPGKIAEARAAFRGDVAREADPVG